MKGIPASFGLAAAKPLLLEQKELRIRRSRIAKDAVEAEKQRFLQAVDRVRLRMQAQLDKKRETLHAQEQKILEVHIGLLDDPALIDETLSMIETNRFACAWAVSQNVDSIALELSEVEDAYIKERIIDIKDVSLCILKAILNLEDTDLSSIAQDSIIVARELTPSQLIAADKTRLKGIVCEAGGVHSHTAILARGLGIPAVFGVKDALRICKGARLLVVNGTEGRVLCDPDQQTYAAIQDQICSLRKLRDELDEFTGKEGCTRDKIAVAVCANIGSPNDAAAAKKNGAQGAGLFRTEFLFMGESAAPCEQTQTQTYSAASRELGGKPIVVRTLDAGGDKKIAYLEQSAEENPFLGCRAIRLCLRNKELFQAQLRAILRASANGKMELMFPMISSLEELRQAKRLLRRCQKELRKENIAFDPDMAVGMMVEIPSAAVCADIFAKEVDFFSIGTNDLIQYTLAVDRGNEKISALYDEYSPSVLRLIYHTAQCAAKEGKPVSVCGEMAANLLMTPLLLAAGVRKLSVSPVAVAKVKMMLSSLDFATADRLLQHALRCKTGREVHRVLLREMTEMKLEHLLLL